MILEYMPYRACEPILKTLVSVRACSLSKPRNVTCAATSGWLRPQYAREWQWRSSLRCIDH
jgi:hypothetical protein